jgi:hypothetical protein
MSNSSASTRRKYQAQEAYWRGAKAANLGRRTHEQRRRNNTNKKRNISNMMRNEKANEAYAQWKNRRNALSNKKSNTVLNKIRRLFTRKA